MESTKISEPVFPTGPSSMEKFWHRLSMRYQKYLDLVNGYPKSRWACTIAFLQLYLLRVFYFQGWYIITYGLFIYLLNLFILFLSPNVDPEEDGNIEFGDDNVKTLPTSMDDEYRPFIRRLPEFKFWISITKALIISLLLTTSRIFDIPVYWPILLGYFVILFVITMRKRIQHMIKHRYLPWSIGKRSYSNNAATFKK